MKKIILLLTTFVVVLVSVMVSIGEEKLNGITLTEAISLATENISGEVVKAEREKGLYEVKIRTADGRIEKIYLDAFTGKPIKKGVITIDEATAIAIREVPGEVIEVEFEKGRFEIKISSDDKKLKEVYVDAKTGEIVKVKTKRRYGK